MVGDLNLESLFLLDIETVPVQGTLQELPPLLYDLWVEKITKTAPESPDPSASFVERAGFQAEFGKIICICVGHFHLDHGAFRLRIKSFNADPEEVLIADFLNLVRSYSQKRRDLQFCGHNIREFDIPFICRRAVIHRLDLPPIMQVHRAKPWEIRQVDTLQLWRFGEYKHAISLKLLAAVLGIASPKEDLDGSRVAGAYWNDHDLIGITRYCQGDVRTVAQLMLRFKGLPLLQDEQVESIL